MTEERAAYNAGSQPGGDCHDPNDPDMFSHIALSLSGGGVRAVGFHLGTLDLLERVDLLRNVHILSTVSGGSLTGTAYALAAQQTPENPFQACFDNLYDFLPELNTLEDILAGITGPEPAAPSGRRELINGMANVFQERFYSRYYEADHFGVFWEGDHNHIKEIMFNATEFRTGNAFRFQKSQFPCRIGNGNVWMHEDHARQMRMGDVMASSCCIPVGMEPLFFPYDFHWPDDDEPGRPTCSAVADYLAAQRQDGIHKPFVPLMDGGVYDNQGLSSVLLAMLRRNKARHTLQHIETDEPSGAERWGSWMKNLLQAAQNTCDGPQRDDGLDLSHLRLFIVSDTPLRSDQFYPKNGGDIPEPIDNRWTRWTLGRVYLLLGVIGGLLAVSAVDNFFELWAQVDLHGIAKLESFRQLVGVLIPMLTCLALAFGLFKFRQAVMEGQRLVESMLPPFRHSLWHYVKKIRVRDAIQMASLRVGSVAALTTKVYMNRIRQLGYSMIYGAGSGPNALGRRIMPNEIYTLVEPDCLSDQLPPVDPQGHIAHIAGLAATMKTAVWVDPTVVYDGRREMDILVAAGQMTCCYNLMRHIRERFGEGEDNRLPPGSVAERYYATLLDLWQRLEQDPWALVDERKGG